MSERRSQSRQSTRLPATIAAGPLRFEAVCTDLGLGGAYLACAEPVQPGVIVRVALSAIDGSRALALPAAVVYVVKPGGRRRAGFAVAWPDELAQPALQGLASLLELAAGHSLTEPEARPAVPASGPHLDAVGADKTDLYDVRRNA